MPSFSYAVSHQWNLLAALADSMLAAVKATRTADLQIESREMARRFLPLLDRVLVQKLEAPSKSVGGILLPENASKVCKAAFADVDGAIEFLLVLKDRPHSYFA